MLTSIRLTALCAIAFLTTANAVLAQSAPNRLIAQARTVDTSIDGEVRAGAWTLTREANPDVFTVEVGSGESREVCFASAPESLCRTIRSGDQFDFVIDFEGFDYPTRIVTRAPAAVFDAAYQAENGGRIQVLIPEVYELVNIAIALTDSGRNDPHLVYKATPYYSEMMAYFADHLDHPLLVALDADMKSDRFKYFRLKMNGYAFEYAGDQIVRSSVYERTGFRGDPTNVLLPYLEGLQSFSDDTGFREFYRAHQSFYGSQIAYYRDEVDLRGMVDWLQGNFPDVAPYTGVKVIFSPLVGANQSLTSFTSNGYNELQPHVNFAYVRQGEETLSPAALAQWRGIIVFGEMNHGYINLAAQPYAAQINEIFADRVVWAPEGGNSVGGYASPVAVFDEYMNWALNTPLFHDRLTPADRDQLIPRLDALMERRGFTQFAAFNRRILELYVGRAEGETMADLYPEILTWAAQHLAAIRTKP